MTKPRVLSVNTSQERTDCKEAREFVAVDYNGVKGDAHAGPGHRQVSILARESIDRFGAASGKAVEPGEFAENITTTNLDLSTVGFLDRFIIGSVILEVTQIGKKCHRKGNASSQELGQCIMLREGVFCRVVSGGTIEPGFEVDYQPRPLTFTIITLSDRAAQGIYEDRSGPRITEIITSFFDDKPWHPHFKALIIPDDQEKLRRELDQCHKQGIDVIITCGGTGIGPRDITPEIVSSFCNKIIPGIMEHIRLKYGHHKPNALLSRSIAGVKDKTVVYALPGSVGAVTEYMEEILKTMEHILFMIHEIDIH
ncbi:molybdenum cofactor synthesis domain-containing protein [candidate division CSSED10-310 bacterium]|uniref:Molybdenum cofactor synthesis domain-containing protein n=1 Tax=candidate division CSSED10-310 bacterium TaxID=2855610 RepID=A0ABV6YWJ8_UNCC1